MCLLTDMDQPLGHAVGHALEVEAVATIQGQGAGGLHEPCSTPARGSHSPTSGSKSRRGAARSWAQADGSALETYERWIRAQGGRPQPCRLPLAQVVKEVSATRDGIVTRLRARAVGNAALEIGGGRREDDVIDHAVTASSAT